MARSFMRGLSANFHSPGFAAFWEQRKWLFTGQLQNRVDQALGKGPLRPGHRTFSPGNPLTLAPCSSGGGDVLHTHGLSGVSG